MVYVSLFLSDDAHGQSGIEALLPVGTLPYLAIGSHWKDGVLADDQVAGNVETFRVPARSARRFKHAKAGVDSGNGQFLIPFDRHPFHARHTNAWCHVVDANSKQSLVIPALEILRFYFGSSSTLLRRIVTPPFDEKRLWIEKKMDIFLENGHIDLAHGIAGDSAEDVARIAFDPEARRCAELISQTLLISQADKHYVQAILPFSGASELSVTGIWLDEEKSRFLVQRILSCSASFPFDELKYTMSREQPRQAGVDRGRTASEGGKMSNLPFAKKVQLGNRPPGPNAAARPVRILDRSVKFPDLVGKEILRTDPAKVGWVLVQGPTEREGSVGDGDIDGSGPNLDLVEAKPMAWPPSGYPPENPAFGKRLHTFVQKLIAEGFSVTFVALDSRQRFLQISRMPEIVDPDGVVHPVSFVEANGKRRPRLVSVISATNEGHRDAIVYVESDRTAESDLVIQQRAIVRIDREWVAEVVARLPC